MAWLYDAETDKSKKYFTSVSDMDSVLDGLDFQTLILEVRCNFPKDKINKETVFKQFMEDLSVRVEDAKFLLNLCMDRIIEKAKE
jgi:hypothetical protein